MIRVERDAQKTNGYQENRNLLLSPHAHADSIPGLEILANDVRCTPGPTGSPTPTPTPTPTATPTPSPLPSGFISVGVVLVGNDGSGATGITFLKVEDSSGNALATPTSAVMPIPSAFDLDGQDITPDATRGVTVDGGNTVYFFSGITTFAPVLASGTVDISAYGGDGDAVGILSNGDEAVLSGDSPTQLVVVSGINAGAPVLADTITIPSNRDALDISRDSKTLLARGSSGLTVFSVTTVPAHPGSLGGTVTHSYAQTADLATGGNPGFRNGRGGMAICPSDSSRAVVLNAPSLGMVSLLTGLPATPTLMAIPIHFPFNTRHHFALGPRRERHEGSRSITLTVSSLSRNSPSWTPDSIACSERRTLCDVTPRARARS